MITAVMFVYNEQLYISKQLDSILNQTVKIDKIVIVDDQSNDDTSKIVFDYQKKFSNITYYYNPNKGKVNAYNLGLSKVETKWFFICAGDDFLFENYVESQLELVRSKNLKFAYAKYIIADLNLNPIVNVPRKNKYTFEELLKSNRVSGYYFASSEVLPIISEIPQKFGFEDWLTSLLFSYNLGDVYLSEKPLFYYRQHPQSTTQKLNRIGVRKRDISFIENLLSYSRITLNQKQKNLLLKRLGYYENVIGNFKYFSAFKLLFSTSLAMNERIRLALLFLPGLNDDNDVERFIRKTLELLKRN